MRVTPSTVTATDAGGAHPRTPDEERKEYAAWLKDTVTRWAPDADRRCFSEVLAILVERHAEEPPAAD